MPSEGQLGFTFDQALARRIWHVAELVSAVRTTVEQNIVLRWVSLADLPALVDDYRRAGLDVDLTMDPAVSAAAVDPAVGQAAFRVVQEALTNAVRHAAGAHVEADIRVEAEAVLIRVSNPTGLPGDAGAGPGFGLRGMRERVAVFGGSLDAGPTAGGGFDVRARLPISTAGTPR